jgi:hypothetical protein
MPNLLFARAVYDERHGSLAGLAGAGNSGNRVKRFLSQGVHATAQLAGTIVDPAQMISAVDAVGALNDFDLE